MAGLNDILGSLQQGVQALNNLAKQASGSLTNISGQLTGAAKAWVSITGSTGAILESFNIKSVVRNSAGIYTVTFTTAFANANYIIEGTTRSGGPGLIPAVSGAPLVGSAQIACYDLTGTTTDPITLYVVCIGRQ